MSYLETDTYKRLLSRPKDNFPEFLIVHHTGGDNGIDTSNQTAKIVEDYHLSLGWEGIGYHFFIDKAGQIYLGRPEQYHGAHVSEANMNKRSIGICLAGNFDVTNPTQRQIEALQTLLRSLLAKYNLPALSIFPHRHYALNPNGTPYKTCYGSRLSDTWAHDIVSTTAPSVDREQIKKQIIDLVNKL